MSDDLPPRAYREAFPGLFLEPLPPLVVTPTTDDWRSRLKARIAQLPDDALQAAYASLVADLAEDEAQGFPSGDSDYAKLHALEAEREQRGLR